MLTSQNGYRTKVPAVQHVKTVYQQPDDDLERINHHG